MEMAILYGSFVKTHSDQLPEFEASPLNEVMMGIQFRAPASYQQIRAFQVWELFQSEFPIVQEHPPLPPQFETFGLPAGPQFNFNMMTGAVHDRFWFLTSSGDQLIQFQQDRILHNWRKVGDKSTYPRFETIFPKFSNEIRMLDGYFRLLGERLVVTQADIAYINLIPINDGPEGYRPQEWLSFVDKSQAPVDEFGTISKQIIRNQSGPYARLYRESATGSDDRGRKLLNLTLTVRGRPATDTIDSALDFISAGRHIIAEEFLTSTTPIAHERWKRTQ